jgi:hypothetical protein
MGLDERGIATAPLTVCVRDVDDPSDCIDQQATLEVSVSDFDDPTVTITLEDGTYILFGWKNLAAALRKCDWLVLAHGPAGDPDN